MTWTKGATAALIPAAGVVVSRRRSQIRTQPIFVQSRRVSDEQARAELCMASSLDTIEGLEYLWSGRGVALPAAGD